METPTALTLAAAVNADDVKTGILVVVVVAFIIFRLMQKHEVAPVLLIAVPVALALFGWEDVDSTKEAGAIVLLGLCLVVELGVGLLLGRSYRMWREADGKAWSQGTAATLLLWIFGGFGVRVVFIALAQILEYDVTEASEILLSLAAAFAGQNIVIAYRAGLLRLERAEPPGGSTPL